MRSYQSDVALRMRSLKGANVQEIGNVKYKSNVYPVFSVRTEKGKKLPEVAVFATIHGDEPAGFHASMEFLESEHDYPFNLTFIPCLNPYGFENDKHENADDVNLNRVFNDNSVQEVNIIKKFLNGNKYLFAVSMHEDKPIVGNGVYPNGKNPNGFYMYELCPRKGDIIGNGIIRELKYQGIEICTKPDIEGWKNEGGILWAPRDRMGKTIEQHMIENHTNHVLNPETLTSWDMQKRVSTQKQVLNSSLEKFYKSQ